MANPRPNTSGLKPFQKGQSGNPSGRAKQNKELKDKAAAHADKAIAALVEIVSSAEASPSARVAAASELLDRGFGKSTQHIEGNVTHSIIDSLIAAGRFDPQALEEESGEVRH